MDDNLDKLQNAANSLLNDSETTHGMKRALRNTLKELSLLRNHIEGKKNVPTIITSRRVQIGGGKHMLEGFINIDFVPPADIIYDVREGIPLPEASVDYIFTEHFLEHIDYPLSVKKVVSECFRIMAKGGEIIIGVPDSEMAVEAYTNKDQAFYDKALSTWYANRNCLEDINTYIDLLNYHFRDQDDDPKYNPHMWAYDFEKLSNLLKSAGFSTVERWEFDPSIANPKREWGSVYVIAVK